MHELSIAQNIIEEVTRFALEEKVTQIFSIRIQNGPLSGVVKESLLFCFDEVAAGTIAEGAKLLFDETELIVKCHSCQAESIAEPHAIVCMKCHKSDVSVISGKEFRLVDMEVI